MTVIFSVLLIIIDRITKYLSVRFLKPAENTDLIKDVLSFTYVENKGAAFGIMPTARWFFVIVTVIVLLALTVYILRTKPESKLFKSASTLIYAGAFGNLIDRVAYGYVVDMIRVHFFDFPVFNFADCCVVVGAVLFCIFILTQKE